MPLLTFASVLKKFAVIFFFYT